MLHLPVTVSSSGRDDSGLDSSPLSSLPDEEVQLPVSVA